MDIRHQNRIKIVQELYSYTFKIPQPFNFMTKTKRVIRNTDQINQYITQFACKFAIEKIARVDLAILQLAIYELTIEKREPPKVIINEAVELARELGSEKSYAFINAVLGKVYESISGFRK